MVIKNCCFTLVLVFFMLLNSAPYAIAEDSKTAHADIPFEFWVGGNRLPAGDYIIQPVESTSYLLFRSTDGRSTVAVFALPIDENSATEAESKLIFRVENGRHYLYGGWGSLGRRVVTAQSAWAAPTGSARIEVPITFTEARRR